MRHPFATRIAGAAVLTLLLAGCTSSSTPSASSSAGSSTSSPVTSSPAITSRSPASSSVTPPSASGPAATGTPATGTPAADMTVAVHLNGAGCDPAQMALPAAPVTLRITDDAGPGEFDIQDSKGDSVDKLAAIDQDQTEDLKVSLPTGYYTVECRTDDTTTLLTVGTPTTPPVDLGSVAAADTPAPAGYTPADGNSYRATNLVANSAAYNPQIVDPAMVDAWGLADRPAGAGGHIWVSANKTGSSLEYVGDVGKTPLNQQDLRVVSVPGATDTDAGAPSTASNLGQPTGIIFNPYADKYVVNQGAIKAAAKFIFAGQDGTISAWTEQANPNGSTTQLAWATKVYDNSAAQSQYFGLALAPGGSRLLVADFGPNPGIKSFDSTFKPVATKGFANPFVHGAIAPGDLIPWNVTTVGNQVYVSYAAVGADESNPKKPSVGEENHQAGAGRVVEYDANGTLVKVLADKGALDAPWGITIAPKGFGKLTGDLLVANFGDGTISAFKNGTFVDYLRDKSGKVLVNPGIWALMPGNGSSLGTASALYFTAGPRGEQDGVFGRIDAN